MTTVSYKTRVDTGVPYHTHGQPESQRSPLELMSAGQWAPAKPGSQNIIRTDVSQNERVAAFERWLDQPLNGGMTATQRRALDLQARAEMERDFARQNERRQCLENVWSGDACHVPPRTPGLAPVPPAVAYERLEALHRDGYGPAQYLARHPDDIRREGILKNARRALGVSVEADNHKDPTDDMKMNLNRFPSSSGPYVNRRRFDEHNLALASMDLDLFDDA